jgi:hypothetical protein
VTDPPLTLAQLYKDLRRVAADYHHIVEIVPGMRVSPNRLGAALDALDDYEAAHPGEELVSREGCL